MTPEEQLAERERFGREGAALAGKLLAVTTQEAKSPIAVVVACSHLLANVCTSFVETAQEAGVWKGEMGDVRKFAHDILETALVGVERLARAREARHGD